MAARKHNLLLVARNASKLAAQCQQLAAMFGVQAQYMAANLSVPTTPAQIFAEAQRRGLEIDVLVNGKLSQLVDLGAELNSIQQNVSALVALTHLFLPPMQARRSGTIINVASMAALRPAPYMATYAASKAFEETITIQVPSVAAQHQLLGLARLRHPLFSILRFEDLPQADVAQRVRLISDLYQISLKKDCPCKLQYGQTPYDFGEGIMSFFAPSRWPSWSPAPR